MITLNEEGIKILSHIFTNMKKISSWSLIEVTFSPTGICINTGMNRMSAAYILLGNNMIENNTFKKEHVCHTRINDMAGVLKKATSFDTVELKVTKGDIMVNLESEQGVRNLGIVPLENPDGEITALKVDNLLAAERFEFKVDSKTVKLFMDVLESYAKSNDDLSIRKTDQSLFVSAGIDRWTNLFQLDTSQPDIGLYWLEGPDGNILTSYDAFKELLNLLIPTYEVTFNVVKERVLFIQQVSDTFSISIGIMGKKKEVTDDPNDNPYDNNDPTEYNIDAECMSCGNQTLVCGGTGLCYNCDGE